jgi:hypothetical protein
LTYYTLARGDIDRAVEYAGLVADQRYPTLVTLLLRPFEPRFRQSAALSALLKRLNLAPAR